MRRDEGTGEEGERFQSLTDSVKDQTMKSLIKVAPALVLAGALAACGTTMEQRAATGAIGGAVAGQVIGGDTGSTVAGAAIGGVAGAATTPRRPN